MRVNVIGTSGSGKTTFGRQLADILNIQFIELDAIFWGPNWSHLDDENLKSQLIEALKGDQWVLDGNYSRTTPIKWKRVEVVIWIDYSFPRTLLQAINRAIQRLFSREEIWPGTGNRETFRMFFSKESIVLWTITTYHRRRKKILKLMNAPEYKQIRFHQLSSPKMAAAFLNAVRLDPLTLYNGIQTQR